MFKYNEKSIQESDLLRGSPLEGWTRNAGHVFYLFNIINYSVLINSVLIIQYCLTSYKKL